MTRLAALLAVASIVVLAIGASADPNEPATKHGYQPHNYAYDHGAYYGHEGPYGGPYDGRWGPGGPGVGRRFTIDAFGIPFYNDALARKFPALKKYQPEAKAAGFMSPSTQLYPNYFALTCTPPPAGPQGVFPGPTTPTPGGLAGVVFNLDDVTPVGPIPYTLWDQSATLLGALGATSGIELLSYEFGGCPSLSTNITLYPFKSEEEPSAEKFIEILPTSSLNVYSIVVKPEWPVDARYFSEYFNVLYTTLPGEAKIASAKAPHGGDNYGSKNGGGYSGSGGYGDYLNKLSVGTVLYGIVEGEGEDGNLYRGTVSGVIDLYWPLDATGDLWASYGGLLLDYLGGLVGDGGGEVPRQNNTQPAAKRINNQLVNNAFFVTIRNILSDYLKLMSMDSSNSALTVQPQMFHFDLENLGPIDEGTRKRLADRRAASKDKKAAAGGAKKSA